MAGYVLDPSDEERRQRQRATAPVIAPGPNQTDRDRALLSARQGAYGHILRDRASGVANVPPPMSPVQAQGEMLRQQTYYKGQLAEQEASHQQGRDERLFQQQQQQSADQAERQRQRDELLAGFEENRDYRQHGFQSERDYLQSVREAMHDEHRAGIQATRDERLNAYQQQAAQQANEWQGQRDERLHGQQLVQDVHHANLQTQIFQTNLTSTERARAEQLRNAIASVQANSDLAPEEQRHMITQLQTGLDPLVARMHQSQVLSAQTQRAAQQQQMEHQAELFNRQQQWLAQGVQGHLQSVVDPTTGRPMTMHLDADMRPTPIQDPNQVNPLQRAQIENLESQRFGGETREAITQRLRQANPGANPAQLRELQTTEEARLSRTVAEQARMAGPEQHAATLAGQFQAHVNAGIEHERAEWARTHPAPLEGGPAPGMPADHPLHANNLEATRAARFRQAIEQHNAAVGAAHQLRVPGQAAPQPLSPEGHNELIGLHNEVYRRFGPAPGQPEGAPQFAPLRTAVARIQELRANHNNPDSMPPRDREEYRRLLRQVQTGLNPPAAPAQAPPVDTRPDWVQNAERFRELHRRNLNEERARAGLPPLGPGD